MSQLSAFAPYLPDGSTTVTVVAGAQALPQVSPSGRPTQFRFANNGTATVTFLAAAAPGTLVNGVPVAAPVASATNGIPLLPGEVEIFTLPPNPQISVFGSGVGSVLTVTPGEGQ